MTKVGRGNLAKTISGISAVLLIICLAMIMKVFFFPAKEIQDRMVLPIEVEILKSDRLSRFGKTEPTAEDIFNKILQEKTYSQMGRFHNIDATLDVKSRAPTLCLICHGNYPHRENKEVRSLYNMHSFFCACETCHTRAPNVTFLWFDNYTGEQIQDIKERVPDGVYAGNYGAKIIPCIPDKTGQYKRLDQPVTEKYVKRFLKLWVQYTYDQKSKAKAVVHKHLTDKPIMCTECHQKKTPVLNFEALGYPKHLCDTFTGTEVSGMIAKYKSFHLPTVFHPKSIIEKKEKLRERRSLPSSEWK